MRGLVLLLLVAGAGVAGDEAGPDHEALARTALEAGDYAGAREHLQAIIDDASGPARARASVELRTFGPPRAGVAAPFTIRRRLERGGKPLASDAVVGRGDRLTMVLTIDVTEPCAYVMVRAPLPAGAEPGGLPIDADEYEFGHRMLLDDCVELAASGLDKGRYVAEVQLHATTAGAFRAPPAQVFAMYDPDKEAHSGPLPLRVR